MLRGPFRQSLIMMRPDVAKLAVLCGTGLLTGIAVMVAVIAACAVGALAFPSLAGVWSGPILLAIAATTIPVALPICLTLIRSIVQIDAQRRDLAAREELLSTAQRIAKLGYWRFNVNSQHFTLSDMVHELIGDPGRTLDMTLPHLLEMTHPDDRDRLQVALQKVLRDGTNEQIEYRLTGLDGVERTFWVDGHRGEGADGAATAYGACQDVTERIRMEVALRESEEHYRYAVELNPQIAWIADANGLSLDVGSRWLEVTGLTREETLGTGWAKALHPDDATPSLAAWSVSLETGAPFDVEQRLCLADGSYRWFRARAAARRSSDGTIMRWYGTIEDIHDAKMAAVALYESEAFARSILESSTNCVKVLDLEGNLQFMNGTGLRMTEIGEFETFRGRPLSCLWPAEAAGRLNAAVARACAGEAARFTGFCPTAKGTPKWWDVSISPIPGADGRPARLLAISRDVTEAQRIQAELEGAKHAAEDAARQLGAVLESTTDCVIVLDREWRFTFLNQRAIDIVAPGRNLLGVNIWQAFPDEIDGPFDHRYRDALNRQTPVEFEEFLPSLGIWLEVHAYPGPDGLSIFFRDASERRRAREQLIHMATHDALTGLANRGLLRQRLDQAIAQAKGDARTAVLFLDLDEFKAVNDTLGHPAGDRLLTEAAERLRECVRTTDTVARCGGDEFAIVQTGLTRPSDAAALAQRIIVALGAPYALDGTAVIVGVSIGIVLVQDIGAQVDQVLKDADIALYRAKAEGRGIYRFFEVGMDAHLQQRQQLKNDLQGALDRRELLLDYQPLVNLKTGGINGFEALLRWRHPQRGLVSPADFIPLAEETGVILGIGQWALRQACCEAAGWPGDITVAVNLSPVQFRSPDLVNKVADALSDSGLAAARLQLEITESVLLQDSEANLMVLHALRRLGVKISMDDFGTGYSSLGYLRRFPFDKIKIDRSFVGDLPDAAGARAIVRAVLGLSRSLGMTTTAEGIETAEQLSCLRMKGCEEGQGFLFGRPMSADLVIDFVQRGTTLAHKSA